MVIIVCHGNFKIVFLFSRFPVLCDNPVNAVSVFNQINLEKIENENEITT